jgi:hypothetical protein
VRIGFIDASATFIVQNSRITGHISTLALTSAGIKINPLSAVITFYITFTGAGFFVQKSGLLTCDITCGAST